MNLLDVVSGFFTPDVVSKMASDAALSDESPANVRKAIGAAVPVIFAGLHQASAVRIGAERIYAVLGETDRLRLLDRFDAMTSRQTWDMATEGQTLLARLLGGDRATALNDLVARSSGIRPAGTAGIMGIVTVVTSAVLARETATRDLDADDLADLLSNHKKAIADHPDTPAGLASTLAAGASGTDMGQPLHKPKRQEPARHSRWLPIALLVGLAAVALWAVARSRQPDRTAVSPPAPPPATTPEIVERVPTTSEDFKLPDGTIVHLDASSGEADLARYLGSGARDLPKRFTMAGLSFELDSNRLAPAATSRVDSLAEILKAYPSCRVRIEGHSDASGNPATNHALSVSRAEEVRRQLVARGVPVERIEIQGKGATQPIAPNNTSEGRAQNRRIEVVVTAR